MVRLSVLPVRLRVKGPRLASAATTEQTYGMTLDRSAAAPPASPRRVSSDSAHRSAATTGTLLYGRTSFWHSERMIFQLRRSLVLTMVVSIFITFAIKTFAADAGDPQRRAIDEAVARVKPSLVRIQV